jgi:acylphosphatase
MKTPALKRERNSVEIIEGARDCQNMDPSQNLKHFLISGRVQGVGFRRFVQAAALRLGVAGTVRNLDDGRVEVVASAAPETMRAFEVELATGPAGSKVIDIVALDVEPGDHSLKDLVSRDFAMQPDGRKEWL